MDGMGDRDAWFVNEVLPLEPMLLRFLRRNWHEAADFPDLLQEVYARAYEAAGRGLPGLSKPFVFMIARNLMIDKLRRRQIVSIDTIADLESLNVPTSEATPERQVSAREELKLLQAALDSVPARQREAILLRKVEGLSQRETAKRMGISEDTVVRHLNKGLTALAEALLGTDIATGRLGVAVLARKKADEE